MVWRYSKPTWLGIADRKVDSVTGYLLMHTQLQAYLALATRFILTGLQQALLHFDIQVHTMG